MNLDQHQSTTENSALDAAIVRSLEQAPEVAIPADFAARVRASLPPQKPRKARGSAARTSAIIAVAAGLAGTFWLAPRMTPSFTSLSFDLEMLLLAELAVVIAWLAQPRREF
jgi:hypothetical protein